MKTYPSLQYETDMAPGDALIFDAQLLQGSIINLSKQTRAAVSMGCTLTEPQFHQKAQFNYIKVQDRRSDNLSWAKLRRKGRFIPASSDNSYPPIEKHHCSILPVAIDDDKITLSVNGELNDNGELLCLLHRMCLPGKPCD